MNLIRLALTATVAIAFAQSAFAGKDAKTIREPAASEYRELNSEAATFLTVLHKSCYNDLEKAMAGGNAIGRIMQRDYKDGDVTVRSWVVTTVTRMGAPSFHDEPNGTLSIEWRSKPRSGPPMMDAPTQWEISCKVDKLSRPN